jgi:transmembrane sensor
MGFGGIAAVAIAAVLLRGPLREAWHRASGIVEQTTGIGERRTVRFDDGSRVELGVRSMIRHPATFPAASRPVTLVGEGYFVVANDSARPFIVTTSSFIAQTTRAAFDVRAYPELISARVVVADGRVTVRSASLAAGREMVLEAGALARLTTSGAITRTDSVDLARYLAWRAGQIILDDVPLRVALIELSRWHDVDLQIGDSVVANRRVTATFASHQTLTEILDVIALQLGARYERAGQTVTFRRAR